MVSVMGVLPRLSLAMMVASDIWMTFVTGPDFWYEFLKCVLTLPTNAPPNFGPFRVSFPLFASKLTRKVSRMATTCILVGMAATSPRSALLRRAANRWEYFPYLQQYYFARFPLTRFLKYLVKKTTPSIIFRYASAFFSDIVRGNLAQRRPIVHEVGATNTNGTKVPSSAEHELLDLRFATAIAEEIRLDSESSNGNYSLKSSAHPDSLDGGDHIPPIVMEGGCPSIATPEATQVAHIEAMRLHPYRTILETHLMEYVSHILYEQSRWISAYWNTPKERRGGVFRHHVVGTAVTAFEFAGSFLVRVLGSRIGMMLWRTNGYGAFWGEAVLHAVGSRLIYRWSNRLGFYLLQKMDRLVPVTEAEVHHEEEVRAREHEAYQEAQTRHTEIVANADDYYQVLGLESTASTDEIKKAYRKLALKLHPDKIQSLPDQQREAAEVEFKRVNRAHSILSDPGKRQEYDAARTMSRPPKFFVFLASLPIFFKVIFTILLLGLGVSSFFGALYAQSIVFLTLLSGSGPGPLRSLANDD